VPPDRRCIQDFALIKEIGNGAVSSVYYALCKKSCLRVAVKIYNKSKLSKLNTRQVRAGGGTERPHAHDSAASAGERAVRGEGCLDQLLQPGHAQRPCTRRGACCVQLLRTHGSHPPLLCAG
jgi:hypothetical protein